MKSYFKLTVFIYLFLLSVQITAIAQKKYKGIPDDLNVSKIIFLKHTKVSIKAKPKGRLEKIKAALQKSHNKNVPVSNKQLEQAVEKYYPFEYVIATRKEIKKYKAEGYKYVLDFEPFINMRKGIRETSAPRTRTHAGTRTTTYYRVMFPLFIKDLTDEDIYTIDHISETFTYYYTGIIKKTLMKPVRSKFNLKK